jgi:hypothetical protein
MMGDASSAFRHDFGLHVTAVLRAWDMWQAEDDAAYHELEKAIEALRTSVAVTVTRSAS